MSCVSMVFGTQTERNFKLNQSNLSYEKRNKQPSLKKEFEDNEICNVVLPHGIGRQRKRQPQNIEKCNVVHRSMEQVANIFVSD
jgi:hypothetical protein